MADAETSTTPIDRLRSSTGRRFWRSLDEAADDPKFQEFLHREFPQNASEWLDGSRRDFLRLMAASLALAGVGGCGVRQPSEEIVPQVRADRPQDPDELRWYATTMELGGEALGILVESRLGRPLKVEGNPLHPASAGGTNVFAQAATLQLYEPDRLRLPTEDGRTADRGRLLARLAALRERWDATQGAGLRFLSQASSSPTLGRLIDEAMRRWPRSKWTFHEPVGDENVRRGSAIAFGPDRERLRPVYRFDRASVVLSIDDDFLAARDRPASWIRDFASRRRVAGREVEPRNAREMVRLFHVGSSPTLTSAKADHRLTLPPDRIVSAVRRLASLIGVDESSTESQGNLSGEEGRWLEFVANDLREASDRSPGSAVVAAGRTMPASVHALVAAMNVRLADATAVSDSRAVVYLPSPKLASPGDEPDGVEGLRSLVNGMESGEVEALFVFGGNPVFDAPANIPFGDALAKVPHSFALSYGPSETASACRWSLPQSHFFETWGDATAFDGTPSIVQPLIAPLHESFSPIGLLAALLADEMEDVDEYEVVRTTWKNKVEAEEREFDRRWRNWLRDGVIDVDLPSQERIVSRSDFADALAEGFARDDASAKSVGEWTLLFRPDPTIWDGRFVDNGWLQELPKPLCKTTWDNVAWISPVDAERLEVEDGDLVAAAVDGDRVVLPVYRAPDQAEGCATLFFGYGRREAGEVGSGTGFDVYPLRRSNALWTRQGASLTPTGESYAVATTQHHFVMEGKHLVRVGSLEEYLADPSHPEFAHPAKRDVDASFFENSGRKGERRWGMVIDLAACTGCGACVIACQAENNVPVVGKKEVLRNREMHWLRVDTYFSGSASKTERTLHQPVPCMHCELAPCEIVCPVAATSHSSDGLNMMVYNRCVGTRYCSNNCPYKVRRFNFFQYGNQWFEQGDLVQLANPEVTVRSRGVMEKCTYCVQRLRTSELEARTNGVPLEDGDATTACQTACPAAAIVFGDLADPDSAVRKLAEHSLDYATLEELNTRPRTTYLAEVANPHPALTEEGEHGD